jgi:proteic killer suppression protein
MIRSFRDKDTKAVFERTGAKRFRSIQSVALRKLLQLEASERLEDLKIPPGNRFEALKGNRKGQYSIRINDQWRVCFEWRESAFWNVEIADYH